MPLIIPKCNADSKTLDLTLKVYYDADKWVTNATLIEELPRLLQEAGIESKQKEPQSYTKKTQVLSYYGLIEWEDPANQQSRRRITGNGRKLYEYKRDGNVPGMQALLLDVLRNNTFGRNVLGCDSDSDLEAPNIFLKSAMLIKDLTNKEFAYILGQLEYSNADLADVLFNVVMKRSNKIAVVPDVYSAKWSDPKPILALADWGLFDVSRQGNTKFYNINSEVLLQHGEELMALRIRNTEAKRDVQYGSYSSILIKEDMDNVTNKYLTAIRTKPFLLLAGISGTGKSRIVRKLAQATVSQELQQLYDPESVKGSFNRWNIHKPANFELIQVKPNWHNSIEVVGYKSNIGCTHYEFTPFVEFVARAWLHQDIPFFLCLDEMNLAPVEQYFAEFLSAIESRSFENGQYVTDPIIRPFESFDTRNEDGTLSDNLSERMIDKLLGTTESPERSEVSAWLRKKGLTLPKNLIVMGTVNMDDTTFSFSRKVLDRAMSIEMNTVAFDSFFAGLTEDDMPELPSDYQQALINRPLNGLYAGANDTETDQEIKETVRNYLTAINFVLEDTPFQLGYRVANEALLYVNAAKIFGCTDYSKALDDFTLMKILSRIEGDKRSLVTKDNEPLLEVLKTVITDDYPQSRKKLEHMERILETRLFVSYWT
ncbi:MAG: hypothetical protein NC206_06420 [Bacteroides sp.]|nr:hypothetical protein [Roseburia sp.]MCM1346703.1 hypothetical protein [Bacteroides sp.]MCM1421472.1 hypothetical protein [Bacteroides sp.]